jgi:hypothetical protein
MEAKLHAFFFSALVWRKCSTKLRLLNLWGDDTTRSGSDPRMSGCGNEKHVSVPQPRSESKPFDRTSLWTSSYSVYLKKNHEINVPIWKEDKTSCHFLWYILFIYCSFKMLWLFKLVSSNLSRCHWQMTIVDRSWASCRLFVFSSCFYRWRLCYSSSNV